MKKYNLLVISSVSLKKLFSKNELSSEYNISWCSVENLEYFKFQLQNSIDLMILDKSFSSPGKMVAANQFSVPKIIISEKISKEAELFFLDQNVVQIIKETKDSQILIHLINNIIENEKKTQEKIKRIETQFQHDKIAISQIDEKTGIYNETTFSLKTKEMLLKNQEVQYVLLRFDIDHFNAFNESYGFAEGDNLLYQIGQAFIRTKKPGMTFGHIRGDHFVICTPYDTFNPEEKISLITNFLNSLYPDFYFIVRMGIYLIENPHEDVPLAISRTLLTLCTAKNSFNKHYAFYDKKLSNKLLDEQEFTSEMSQALEKENFAVYFQPQYDYTTESLSGAEALVRWQHPIRGLISPGLFIPLFEQNGFITKLDEFMWDKSCSYMRKWIDQGFNPVPVSVNISRRDIYNPNLVQHFKDLLKKYNLSPKHLRLEITESAYMENPEQLINVVKELQKIGFIIEMDDFGSGYSSLNTLKDVPVDILKLDMKFIESNSEKEQSSRGGSILSSIVRMANWLKLPVIAEGIETKSQADFLKSIGCFNMQGFFFAKPMPAADYEELLSTLPVINEKTPADSELFNAINFLDATNQNALLFNNFVGGVAIIEWTGTTIEPIRINDQYFEELNTTRDSYAHFQKDFLGRLDKSSRNVFLSTLAESKRSKKEVFCEIQCLPTYTGGDKFWIRSRIRYLAKTVTSDIYYLAIENIDFRMKLLDMNTNLSEQLTAIMETVPCGILILCWSETPKVTFSNEKFASILGYSTIELRKIITENPFSIITEKNKKKIKQTIKNNIEMRIREFSIESTFICKSGSEKKLTLRFQTNERSNGSLFLNIIALEN